MGSDQGQPQLPRLTPRANPCTGFTHAPPDPSRDATPLRRSAQSAAPFRPHDTPQRHAAAPGSGATGSDVPGSGAPAPAALCRLPPPRSAACRRRALPPAAAAPCRAARVRAQLRIPPFSQIGRQRAPAAPRPGRAPQAGRNTSATPLIQCRLPVGAGPSSNTWPRCPPQRRQCSSTRVPNHDRSARLRTASGSAAQKLGQPVPLSNFCSDE